MITSSYKANDMNINGKTKTFGLIGNPVEHSLSPFIHNFISEKMGINAVYTTFKVCENEAAVAIKGAYALNIQGMNVTVPHKREALMALDEIEDLAKAIGAINTIVRCDGYYKGYNTDIIGLKRELEDENISLKDREVVILGAGGASRAIAFLCANENAKKIIILNRTLQKAQDIAKNVNDYFKKDIATAHKIEDYKEVLTSNEYIAIQTSSVGLHPNIEDVVISDGEFYDKLSYAVDIIYNPLETKFMSIARKHNVPAYNGLKMLMYQAIASYELWNNIKVSDDTIKELYECLEKQFNE